jgi:hypothetical protein
MTNPQRETAGAAKLPRLPKADLSRFSPRGVWRFAPVPGWPASARPHWDCVWPLSKELEEIMSGSNPKAAKDFNCASGSFERDVSDGLEKKDAYS